MSALLASPARIQRQLLVASPGTRLTFGEVRVSVHAYGFEATGGVEREWCYGDAMARDRVAGRVAETVAAFLAAPVLAAAS